MYSCVPGENGNFTGLQNYYFYQEGKVQYMYSLGRVTDLCHHVTSSKITVAVLNIIDSSHYHNITLRCISTESLYPHQLFKN